MDDVEELEEAVVEGLVLDEPGGVVIVEETIEVVGNRVLVEED